MCDQVLTGGHPQVTDFRQAAITLYSRPQQAVAVAVQAFRL